MARSRHRNITSWPTTSVSSATSCACWPARGCRLTVVLAQTSADEVLAMNPDGVFLSNGPGDPEPCDYAISAIKTIVGKGVPTFGICLGHQLLAPPLAGARQDEVWSPRRQPPGEGSGFRSGDDYQPEPRVRGGRRQPAGQSARHACVLFDGSLQGIARTDAPAFSFQGHPEASPGPHDVAYLFDRFIKLMDAR